MLESTPFSSNDTALGLFFSAAILIIAFIWLRVTTRGRSSREDKTERTVILGALIVKILSCWAYSITLVYYYGVGDTLSYHENGIQYASLIRSDLATGLSDYLSRNPFFWIKGISTERFESLSGLVHFLLFDSFLASSLVFGLIGFAGQVLLYRTFTEQYPDPRIRVWWRIGILFFPSMTFWSAGMLKDPMGIWGIGCAVRGVHRFLQRPHVKSLALTVLGLYTIFLFRLQVLPVMLIALVAWFLTEDLRVGKQRTHKATSVYIKRFVRASLLLISLMALRLIPEIAPSYAPEVLSHTVSKQSGGYAGRDAGSTTEVVTSDSSLTGMIRAWPEAIVLTLYRPFVWEVPSVVMLLSAIENLVLLLLTLRAAFRTFTHPTVFMKALRSPMFLACLAFVALFALGVGVSSPNLGTISRYRIPLVPFFVGMLAILEYHTLEVQSLVRHRHIPIRRPERTATVFDNRVLQ